MLLTNAVCSDSSFTRSILFPDGLRLSPRCAMAAWATMRSPSSLSLHGVAFFGRLTSNTTGSGYSTKAATPFHRIIPESLIHSRSESEVRKSGLPAVGPPPLPEIGQPESEGTLQLKRTKVKRKCRLTIQPRYAKSQLDCFRQRSMQIAGGSIRAALENSQPDPIERGGQESNDQCEDFSRPLHQSEDRRTQRCASLPLLTETGCTEERTWRARFIDDQ